MTSADAPAINRRPPARGWAVAGCALQSLLIAWRAAAVLGAKGVPWACALPAYLPLTQGLIVVLGPAALLVLAVWLSTRNRRVVQPSAAYRQLWIFALAPALVLAFPDRAGFMGDYLFRQGSILSGRYPTSFPQSLPLDRLVQGVLLPVLGAHPTEGELPGARWIGLIACIAFAALVARWSARAGGSGTWGTAAWACVVLGGYLCVFTGYARDVVESLPLIALLLFALSQRVDGKARLSPAPELALAALLMLHRSALCLVPAYSVGSISHLRNASASARRHGRWVAAGVVLMATVVILAPRYLGLLLSFDLAKHASWASTAGALPPPLADPRSLWDIFNALLMLAPISILAWLGPVTARSAAERAFLIAASLGWLIPMLLVRPQQGAFRDYDVYAGAALTLAFVAVLGLERLSKRGQGVDKALIALSFISTLQAGLGLLLVSSNAAATEARVHHGLAIADMRLAGANAGMSDYLALNAERRGQWGDAARAYADAAAFEPSPTRLALAGRAAAYTGDWRASSQRFADLIARDSTSAIGWSGFAGAQRVLASGREDSLAEARLLEICSTRVSRQIAIAYLNFAPVLDSDGALRAKLAGVR